MNPNTFDYLTARLLKEGQRLSQIDNITLDFAAVNVNNKKIKIKKNQVILKAKAIILEIKKMYVTIVTKWGITSHNVLNII